jgi:hypothetical protein
MLSRAVERRMDALVEQVEHARRQNEALIEKLIEKEAYIKARLAEVSAQRNDARLIEELRHQLAIERNFSLKILKELKPLKDREARRQAEHRRRERTKMRAAGIDEDDPDFTTLLDNECDGRTRIARMLWASIEAADAASAAEYRVAKIKARQAAFEARSERLRDIAMWMMGEIGIKRVQEPEFIATVTTPKDGPVIVTVDISELPARFVRVKKEVDKTAIKTALVAGEDLSSIAIRGNPKPHLTIRS